MSLLSSPSASSPPRSTFDVYPFGTPRSETKTTNTKVLHFVRHAEGTHNVKKDYRNKVNLDAPLTDKGRQQCQALAERIATATENQDAALYALRESADLIVTSPLTRCIQTATLSFPSLLKRQVPMVAHEMIRETVNYNCDRRRNIDIVNEEHSHVDYSHVQDNHDQIWKHYEQKFGCDETFTRHRESGEIHVVAERGRAFFQWLAQQPQKHIVVCTHSAFLRCLKNYGNNPDAGPLGVPLLPKQHAQPPSDVVPVLQYHSDALAQQMRRTYENCELRSVVMEFNR